MSAIKLCGAQHISYHTENPFLSVASVLSMDEICALKIKNMRTWIYLKLIKDGVNVARKKIF